MGGPFFPQTRRHIQGRSLPLYAGRSAVVRARVEQVVVGGDVFPGPMPVKLSSGCSKLFYLDKMSFRLRESAVLAGLDQGEWFHEFDVFRWTRRNRIPTSTIEESEVVG